MTLPHPELANAHCVSRPDILDDALIAHYLSGLPEWSRENVAIQRRFTFENFYLTIGFVNALAWMANREDHHPDLVLGYDHCTVKWSTHAAGGLTRNDFICAVRTNALIDA